MKFYAKTVILNETLKPTFKDFMLNKLKNKPIGNFIHFFAMTLLSGGMMGICATASLTSTAFLESGGKIVGSLLFSLGIFVILAFEMKLFTGLVPNLPHAKAKDLWQYPVCLLGNFLGVYLVYLLISATHLKSAIVPIGAELISSKLQNGGWALSSVCSGALCGILITLSVLSVKHSHKKGLSANVGVIFPIIVFAFCGFDHSIANMFYFYCLGEISWQIVGYISLTILGNVIGGIILPLVLKLKDSDSL